MSLASFQSMEQISDMQNQRLNYDSIAAAICSSKGTISRLMNKKRLGTQTDFGSQPER